MREQEGAEGSRVAEVGLQGDVFILLRQVDGGDPGVVLYPVGEEGEEGAAAKLHPVLGDVFEGGLQVAEMISKLSRTFESTAVKLLLVEGDTNSVLAGASAARKGCLKIEFVLTHRVRTVMIPTIGTVPIGGRGTNLWTTTRVTGHPTGATTTAKTR